MAFIGYQQTGPDLYRFTHEDGRTQSLYGPAALSLKDWIDQTRGPDRRMADVTPDSVMAGSGGMNGASPMDPPAPPPMVSDAGGMSVAPPPPPPPPPGGISVAPPPPPPPPPPRAPLPPALSTPHQVVQAPRPAAAPSPPAGRIEEPPSAEKLQPWPGASAAAPKGPTFDPLRGSAPPTPSGGGKSKLVLTEESSEGINRTPEDIKATEGMLAAKQASDDAAIAEIKAISDQRTAAYEQQSADAADAALDAHDRQLRAQDQAANVEAAWNKTFAGLQKEQDATANQKIDPRRLFNGEGGTLNAIGSTLGVALGAFGASITGGPNYAHQIVQAAIDRDINAQADAIHAKRERADNALANFMKVHGLDVQEAKLAVRALGQEYAASQAQIRANQIGTLDARQKAAELIAKLNDDKAKSWAELAAKVKNKETLKFKMAGGGPAAPAWRTITDPDTGKTYLQDLKTGEIKQTVEGGDVFNTGGKPKGAGGPGKLSARLGAGEAVNEAAQKDLAELEKADPGGWVGLPAGGKHIYRTDAQIDLEAKARAFASKFIAANGEPLTEEAQKIMVEQLTDRNPRVREETRKAIGSGARTYHQAIERQRGNVEGGIGPEQEGP